MQDFRSMMNGGGGRIFGGERRLRPFPNQALKCPRCDSLNTKFCYYNNYNLSQPRHFCKSCRRYWTKGGVLRNVPVGGGCRKTKRSKPKTSIGENEKTEKKSTTSHSSSDSSSLTATTTTEAASSNSGGGAAAALVNFPESATATTTLPSQNPNSNLIFEQSMMQINSSTIPVLDQVTEKSEMFPETGGFTRLMNASNPSPFLGFNFSEISPFRLNHQQEEEQMQQQKIVEDQLKFQELAKGLIYDQTVDLHDLSNRGNGGGLTALDWQQSSNGGGGIHDDHHQGLFDLPNSSTVVVDDHHHHQSFWSQTSQWTDQNHDHSLYLP